MPHHRQLPLTLLIALVGSASVAGAPAVARAQTAVTRRVVGDYSFGGGGQVRVDVDGARIALFAADGSGSRVLIHLDPPSVDRWLATADAVMRGGGRSAVGAETQTPPLMNTDPSVGGSVVLTRQDVRRIGGTTTEYYLTATGDADHIALLPLSAMDTRIVTAALRRAVDASRGAGAR